MANEERKTLVAEATEIGLGFAPNISTKKLQAMVDEAKGVVTPDDVAPVVKPDAEVIITTAERQPLLSRRQKAAAFKRAAMRKKVVTITNKDARDNEHTTTAVLGFENNYFGLTRVVPLDTAVELEVSLIKIAKAAMMTVHRDEYKNGKKTGLKITMRVGKYAVSYGEAD